MEEGKKISVNVINEGSRTRTIAKFGKHSGTRRLLLEVNGLAQFEAILEHALRNKNVLRNFGWTTSNYIYELKDDTKLILYASIWSIENINLELKEKGMQIIDIVVGSP